jgi:formate dehydrogenase subunit gamma
MLMKNLHNFIGPLFLVSIVLFAVIYVRHNFPSKGDFGWLMSAGGLLSEHQTPSGRFNAGEKGWFWLSVVCLGTVMGVTGLIMLFPNFEQVRATMQQANIVHGVGGVLFIAMSFAHIYLGTIGTEGAYQGMRTGYVDEEWAKEHHELWYDDVKSGKAGGSDAKPAPAAQPQH